MTETIIINGRAFPVVSSTPVKAAATVTKRKARKWPLLGAARESGTLSLSVVPPSVNALFYNRRSGKGRGKTLAYRNWSVATNAELCSQPPWHVPGKVEVRIYLPANTRGDADNRIKALLDSLVRAGRIEDDRNVVKVSAEFSQVEQTVVHIQAVK